MSTLEVTKIRFHSGTWEGLVRGAREEDRPDLRITHDDRVVENVDLSWDSQDKAWRLSIPVPRDAIAEGLQTVLIADAATDTKLADFALFGGDADADGLRAEVSLLRAELDMLKRAFRRHCVETA